MSVTVEQAQAQRDRELAMRFAMDRLLHGLKKYIRIYAMRPGVEMPEHEPVWVCDMDYGPEKVILDAIKANPELWREALPETVCIVPRALLQKYVGSVFTEALEGYGKLAVDNHAARMREQNE